MKKFLIVVALVGCASAAGASTVTFTLDLQKLGAGNFELRAKSSAGDNGGLASYHVPLTNVATVNHNSLRNAAATNADGSLEGPVGFTLLRTADDTNAATVGPADIYGSQDTITPTPFIIYGMGQTAGDLSSRGIITAGSKEGDPWASDAIIAVGSYTPGQFPAFNVQSHLQSWANVFTVAGATATTAASIEQVTISLDGTASFTAPGSFSTGGTPIAPPPPQTTVETPPAVPLPSPALAPLLGPTLTPAFRPRFDPFASAPHSPAGVPVSVELTRRSRPVASHEIAGGAPEGYVHEFFVSSTTDVIGIYDVELDGPVYQNKFGMDYRPPNAKLLQLFPGISADSFLDTPGHTYVMGNYATGLSHPETVWYDTTSSGPQEEFLFARLTIGETGVFSGTLSVAGPSGPVEFPFKLVLPGTAEELTMLDGEPTFVLGAALVGVATSQIPEPAAWLLMSIGVVVCSRRRVQTNAEKCRDTELNLCKTE